MYKKIFESVKRLKKSKNTDVYYIVEGKNWATVEVAKDIVPYLRKKVMIVDDIQYRYGSVNTILHFGSLNVFLDYKYNITQKGKRIIVTCFHIVDDDPRKYLLKEKDRYVEKWHTSCQITRDKLITLGIPAEKIAVIPIGIEEKNYAPVKDDEKKHRQYEEGIESGTVVIGYFQKDGNGWEEGNQPKLIKGPDVFCNVVEKLKQRFKIHVILSGPSRGYVKNRLRQAGVPFTHHLFENASDVAELYKMIDVYMVTSREEGGPRAILESMASGVPIISTRVGQAPDIIRNNENGILVEIEDEDALISSFEKLVECNEFRKKIIKNGLETAKHYSSKRLAEQYDSLLYNV